jgi:hypothetical protein
VSWRSAPLYLQESSFFVGAAFEPRSSRLKASPIKKKGNQLPWKQGMVRDTTYLLTKSVGSIPSVPHFEKGG